MVKPGKKSVPTKSEHRALSPAIASSSASKKINKRYRGDLGKANSVVPASVPSSSSKLGKGTLTSVSGKGTPNAASKLNLRAPVRGSEVARPCPPVVASSSASFKTQREGPLKSKLAAALASASASRERVRTKKVHAKDETLKTRDGRNKKKEGNKGTDKCAGFIFMCNAETKHECYQRHLLGLPQKQIDLVRKIKPGIKLYLFDLDLKLLYGIYKATSRGGIDLVPNAFNGRFPAQVEFTVHTGCLPLQEKIFRHAIQENYDSLRRFSPVLTLEQVQKLQKLFEPISSQSREVPRHHAVHKHPLGNDRHPRFEDSFYSSPTLSRFDHRLASSMYDTDKSPLVMSELRHAPPHVFLDGPYQVDTPRTSYVEKFILDDCDPYRVDPEMISRDELVVRNHCSERDIGRCATYAPRSSLVDFDLEQRHRIIDSHPNNMPPKRGYRAMNSHPDDLALKRRYQARDSDLADLTPERRYQAMDSHLDDLALKRRFQAMDSHLDDLALKQRCRARDSDLADLTPERRYRAMDSHPDDLALERRYRAMGSHPAERGYRAIDSHPDDLALGRRYQTIDSHLADFTPERSYRAMDSNPDDLGLERSNRAMDSYPTDLALERRYRTVESHPSADLLLERRYGTMDLHPADLTQHRRHQPRFGSKEDHHRGNPKYSASLRRSIEPASVSPPYGYSRRAPSYR